MMLFMAVKPRSHATLITGRVDTHILRELKLWLISFPSENTNSLNLRTRSAFSSGFWNTLAEYSILVSPKVTPVDCSAGQLDGLSTPTALVRLLSVYRYNSTYTTIQRDFLEHRSRFNERSFHSLFAFHGNKSLPGQCNLLMGSSNWDIIFFVRVSSSDLTELMFHASEQDY